MVQFLYKFLLSKQFQVTLNNLVDLRQYEIIINKRLYTDIGNANAVKTVGLYLEFMRDSSPPTITIAAIDVNGNNVNNGDTLKDNFIEVSFRVNKPCNLSQNAITLNGGYITNFRNDVLNYFGKFIANNDGVKSIELLPGSFSDTEGTIPILFKEYLHG